MQIRKAALWVFGALLFLNSCREEMDSPSWNVDMLAPIVSGSLNIRDLLPDSMVSVGSDNGIALVYQNELYSFSLDSFLKLNDTNFTYQAYLQKIKINPVSITQSITLGQLIQDAGLSGLIPDGANLPIPAFSGLTSDDILIDGTPYFQTMTLLEGYLDLKIQNGLSIGISNLIFGLKNFGETDYLLLDTFPVVEAGGELMHTYSLAGKTVKGNLVGKILNLDTPGSNGQSVAIHYPDAITTNVTIRNLKPFSATAIFPAQDLLDKGDKIHFKMGSVALDRIVVRSGQVRIDAYNTLADPMHYSYSFPGAILQGDTFKASGTVPAAQNGVASVVHNVFDLTGYEIDFRGAGPIERFFNKDLNANGIIDADTINTAFVLAKGSIDSTGHLISLSLQDSFVFHSYLENLVPDYAHGFLGQDTIPSAGFVDLDLFQGIQGGTLSTSDIRLDLSVSNPIGSSAGLYFRKIRALNSKTLASKTLDIQNGLNPFYVGKPLEPLPGLPVVPVEASLHLDKSNSNALDLINILPDRFEYDLDFFINPQQIPPPIGGGTDFIFYESRAKAFLNLEVPLSILSNQLTLTDTLDIEIQPADIENLNQGSLYLIADNDFPFDARITLVMLDALGADLDILLADGLVNAAQPDPVTGKTTGALRSRVEMILSQEKLMALTQSKKIRVTARFDTPPQAGHVKLYDEYRLRFTLSGQFNVSVGSNNP